MFSVDAPSFVLTCLLLILPSPDDINVYNFWYDYYCNKYLHKNYYYYHRHVIMIIITSSIIITIAISIVILSL